MIATSITFHFLGSLFLVFLFSTPFWRWKIELPSFPLVHLMAFHPSHRRLVSKENAKNSISHWYLWWLPSSCGMYHHHYLCSSISLRKKSSTTVYTPERLVSDDVLYNPSVVRHTSVFSLSLSFHFHLNPSNQKKTKKNYSWNGHFCVKYLGRPAVIFSSQKSRKIFFKGKNYKKQKTFSLGALSSPMQSAALYCCCRCCCCCCWCGSLRDGWARWREMGKERLPIPSPLRFFFCIFSFVLFLGFFFSRIERPIAPDMFLYFSFFMMRNLSVDRRRKNSAGFPPRTVLQ